MSTCGCHLVEPVLTYPVCSEGFAQFEVVWKRRYKVMSQMLDPDPESKEFKAMQKTLSRAKSNHQPFTEEERERWLSLDGFYQIVGLVTLNLDDAGGLYALHAHLNHSCEPTIRVRPNSSERY